MKPYILPLIALAFVSLLPVATGQDTGADLKHLMATPQNGNRTVLLTALNIERGVAYPSVIHLKGNVEIRTPVCLAGGPQTSLVCGGEMIVRADAAEFHEDTGEIEAQGTVHVTPLSRKK